ncbi:MAG TPA: beta-N-acetylhexosaminidase [Bacillales bacterium]
MDCLSQMSLREKIGQLMLIGFEGTTVTPRVANIIKEDKIGGVILFPRNIQTPEQVLRLNIELQSLARNSNHPFPLFVTTDQENGIVRRLKAGVTQFPGNMLLGAVDDREATRKVSRAAAAELKALGLNMNLAPVLDVNNNSQNPVIGVRSFGERTEDVAEQGVAFIQGHHDAGVMTTVKHFPGHGDTALDSHSDLPVITHSMERLEEVELPPFVEAINAGTDSVMMSHIYFPALDRQKDLPASLSKNVTTGLLREKLGFAGVIMTDCLEMNAVVKMTGTVEGALEALKAGSDLLMISHTYELQIEAMNRIEQAVKEGEVDEELIDRAVERVMKLKKKQLSWNELPEDAGIPSFVDGEEHQKLAQKQYERGVTLVKNESVLPLKVKKDSKILVVTIKGKMHSPVEGKRQTSSFLAGAVSRRHSNVLEKEINLSPDENEIDEVIAVAEQVDVIIFGSDYAYTNETQALLVRKLLDKPVPLIVVAVGNPYDLASFRGVSAYLATYEYSRAALQAAADMIFGKVEAHGKLPVTIP